MAKQSISNQLTPTLAAKTQRRRKAWASRFIFLPYFGARRLSYRASRSVAIVSGYCLLAFTQVVVGGTGIFHPKGTRLTQLDVIPSGNLSTSAQQALVGTLQGLVAKTSGEQIYIDEGGPTAVYKNYMNIHYGIPLNTSYSTWQLLVTHFKGRINGYVLYNYTSNPGSLNAATSLCGALNSIAVDSSLESSVRSLGVTNNLIDVSSRSDQWVYTNYYPGSLNTHMVSELSTNLFYHLRDYSTLANAFTFYDGNGPFRTSIMQGLALDAFCFGYGDYSAGENVFVGNSASYGVPMVPSDTAPNLSAHSSIYETNLVQHTHASPVFETNVHYVCFVMSDGDNIGADLWTLNQKWSDPARGRFNMGYGLSPSMVDVAPGVMRYYYESASNGVYKDSFVAGPSGSGYTYPTYWPANDLPAYLTRLNAFMGAADLNICEILDFDITRMDVWNQFLAQTNIDALFYFPYGSSTSGQILWSVNGKPVVAQRDIMWSGIESPTNLEARINSETAAAGGVNVTNAAAYTLVLVHIWDYSLSDVVTAITNLDSRCRVVTPDVFVKLISANVGGPIASGTYKLINENSSAALDVPGSSTNMGVSLDQATYNGGLNQLWQLAIQGGGKYLITSANSGLAMEDPGSNSSAGTRMDQSTVNLGANQIWQAVANGDGTYRLINQASALVLAVTNSSIADGAAVIQSAWNGGSNQRWYIYPITVPPPVFAILSSTINSAGTFTMSWQAAAGTSYTVWKKQQITDATWTKLANVLATNSVAQYSDSAASGVQCYYEVIAR